MGNLREMLKHPDEFYLWLKAKMEVKQLHKQISTESNRKFSSCLSILIKLHRFCILIVNLLSPEFREPISIFYLILRALDTVEDDMSISTEVKVPILLAFHRHIYDPDWHFACGRGTRYEILMDQFHHVSSAFLELGSSYQEVITDITKRMGEGMAKFISKEVETLDDYDEYCHYVSGLVVIGLSKIFHDNGKEKIVPESLSNSLGLFLQKANIIRDYLEDINEKPMSRMFWPREIWSKYANELEDFKYEENSTKAVQCLNDMVTNFLIHVEDTLKYMSELQDPVLMKALAAPVILGFGTIVLCYNNIEVFRGTVGLRRGLLVKFIYRTETIADVYVAVYDFASMLKSKVDMNDPNATLTLSRIDAILKSCQDSGTLNERKSWKSYIIGSKPNYSLTLVETLDDYDEYCHYVSGFVVIGLSKIFHDNGKEKIVPESLSNSLGLFLQKANIIRDYLEDINEKPMSRMFWPRVIWSKYANELEEFKYEENSTKAVQCLNDMVTNFLIHVEDTLKYMSELRDPVLMKSLAAPVVLAFGTVALCYNNIEVFRGAVGLRRGLAAKFIYRTETISDIYVAFYDFASMLKSKVDMNDPNATLTLSRIDAILKSCQDSGTLNERKSWKSYIIRSKANYSLTLIIVLFIFLGIICSYLSLNRPESFRFLTSLKFKWEADKHYKAT